MQNENQSDAATVVELPKGASRSIPQKADQLLSVWRNAVPGDEITFDVRKNGASADVLFRLFADKIGEEGVGKTNFRYMLSNLSVRNLIGKELLPSKKGFSYFLLEFKDAKPATEEAAQAPTAVEEVVQVPHSSEEQAQSAPEPQVAQAETTVKDLEDLIPLLARVMRRVGAKQVIIDTSNPITEVLVHRVEMREKIVYESHQVHERYTIKE